MFDLVDEKIIITHDRTVYSDDILYALKKLQKERETHKEKIRSFILSQKEVHFCKFKTINNDGYLYFKYTINLFDKYKNSWREIYNKLIDLVIEYTNNNELKNFFSRVFLEVK